MNIFLLDKGSKRDPAAAPAAEFLLPAVRPPGAQRAVVRAIALLALICGAIFCPPIVEAAPKPVPVTFDSSRARVLRLLETDPDVSQLSHWEDAASDLFDFIKQNPKSKNVPNSMFLLGKMYERTYR